MTFEHSPIEMHAIALWTKRHHYTNKMRASSPYTLSYPAFMAICLPAHSRSVETMLVVIPGISLFPMAKKGALFL
ncbi:hypothetical protein ACEU2D_09775 [Brevibacillus laterosporus]|uniref:hypothetical protein n=1 Tax=Brevibacillus laterosporus TaxID=1465 RepID=UPI0035A5AF6B